MNKLKLSLLTVAGSLYICLTQGCATALHPAASTGTVMYTMGARQHTAMLQIALPPADVYSGLLRIVKRDPAVVIENQNDKRFLLEVEKNSKRLTGQATDLGRRETLLFLWADAGDSSETGAQLMKKVVKEICTELAVKCEVKER